MNDTLLFAQFKDFETGKEYQLFLLRDLFGQLSLVRYSGSQRNIKLFEDLNSAWREAQSYGKRQLNKELQLVKWESRGLPTPEFVTKVKKTHGLFAEFPNEVS